ARRCRIPHVDIVVLQWPDFYGEGASGEQVRQRRRLVTKGRMNAQEGGVRSPDKEPVQGELHVDLRSGWKRPSSRDDALQPAAAPSPPSPSRQTDRSTTPSQWPTARRRTGRTGSGTSTHTSSGSSVGSPASASACNASASGVTL